MITSGFFDSINHDRRYNAEQFASIFDGIVRDGIYMSIGSRFNVRAQEPNSMNIIIGSGRAWFNHCWIYNDSDEIMKIEISELLSDRIDAVVFDVDSSLLVRRGSIKIIKGDGAKNPVPPTLIKVDGHWQYPLAYIKVEKDTSTIRQANITNMIGTSESPFVTGPLETINADMLLAQWNDEYRAWYETFTEESKTELFDWYNTVKGLLGTDPGIQLAMSLAETNNKLESATTKIAALETQLASTNNTLTSATTKIAALEKQLNGWSIYKDPLTQAQYDALPASEKNTKKRLHIIKK